MVKWVVMLVVLLVVSVVLVLVLERRLGDMDLSQVSQVSSNTLQVLSNMLQVISNMLRCSKGSRVDTMGAVPMVTLLRLVLVEPTMELTLQRLNSHSNSNPFNLCSKHQLNLLMRIPPLLNNSHIKVFMAPLLRHNNSHKRRCPMALPQVDMEATVSHLNLNPNLNLNLNNPNLNLNNPSISKDINLNQCHPNLNLNLNNINNNTSKWIRSRDR